MRPESRQTLLLVAGNFGAAAIGMGYAMYAARALDPAEGADFFAALALVALVTLAVSPLGGSLARFVAALAATDQHAPIAALAARTARISAVTVAAAAVAVVALHRPLARALELRVSTLLIACGAAAVLALAAVPRGVLRGYQRFADDSFASLVDAGVRLVTGVALLRWLGTAAAALLGYLIAAVVGLAYAWRQMRVVVHPTTDRSSDGSGFGGFLFAFALATAASQNIDVLVVKSLFSPGDAGLYGAAAALARQIEVIALPIQIAIVPVLTRKHTRGEATLPVTWRLCGYFLLAAAVPLAIVWTVPGQVVGLLYGERYAGAAALLPVLALAQVIGTVAKLVASAAVARGSFRFVPGFFVILGIQLAVMLVSGWSVHEMAWVMVAAQGSLLGCAVADAATVRGREP